MANTNAPFGFRQWSGTGSSPTYEQVTVFGGIAYNTAPIYKGDPVFRLADGTLAGATTGPGPGTAPIAGIFVGCKYLSTSLKHTQWSNYWPGADVSAANQATIEAYIINDPAAQFIAQVGGSTTVGATAGNVGLNVQFAYGTSNPVPDESGAYVNIAVAPATTSTFPFRLVGLHQVLGTLGGVTGPYNTVIVAFNNVETKALTATN